MTDRISQLPIPPLDPPEQFAGGEVVAAARCPVDVSTHPRRHVIVVKHAGERQTFSINEVAHNDVEWVAGQGHYDLSYAMLFAAWLRRPSVGHDWPLVLLRLGAVDLERLAEFVTDAQRMRPRKRWPSSSRRPAGLGISAKPGWSRLRRLRQGDRRLD